MRLRAITALPKVTWLVSGIKGGAFIIYSALYVEHVLLL